MDVPVRVGLLGPLRLVVGDEPVDVRGQKRRAVLVLLALAEGRTVPAGHLVDALWPGEAPDSGRQAVHSHVFRLRAHLGPAAARLETRPDGYRLDLGPDGLDAAQARSLLASARAMLPRDPAAAAGLLRRAHALWRGPMLADLTGMLPVAAAVQGYVDVRRDVTDTLIDAAVAAGDAGAVAGLAAESLADDPLREPAVLRRMRVLAATGRAPEALRAGREFRERLADEAGLDPSPALDALIREIATGPAAPARPAAATRPRAQPAAPARAPAHPPAPADPAAQAAAPADPVAQPADPAARPASPPGRLHGRDAEVGALHRLLAAERLVTVVGPGGVGKTRLALEVAHRDPDAAVLRLAPVTEPAAIPHALAAALGLSVVQRDVLASCVAVLGDRPGLLLADNCEHLLDAARETVGRLLAECPRLTVLATSREPLGLAAEHLHRLAPLPLPGPREDPAGVASVAVFTDRAARVRPGVPLGRADLDLVADIVRRLDGMPLAIELAAGRLSSFSVADLHRRLDRALDLLGGRAGGDARHRTLRETVEWSYRLLSADERRLFRHLAAFADGAGLDAAERLGAGLGLAADPGSALARLVDASMIDASFGPDGTRYRMLETLRAFGVDRLAAEGETGAAHRHVVRWAADLTTEIAAVMRTGREPEADAVLRREMANLRTAWRLARGSGDVDAAATMVIGLSDAVAYRDLIEIRDWAEELADDPALAGHPREAAVLGTAAEAAYHRGDHARADKLARTGLDRGPARADLRYCLLPLSVAELARGAYPEAAGHAMASAEVAPDREGFGVAALARAYAGRLDEARELSDRAAAARPASPSMRSWVAFVSAEVDVLTGHAERAEREYVRAVEQARAAGATFLAGVASVGLQVVRAGAGRVDEALRGYREVVDYFARTGNWTHLWTTLRNLADVLRRLGDAGTAALLDAAADRAPDAPPVPAAARESVASVPGRAEVLRIARAAIDRHLRTAPQTPPR